MFLNLARVKAGQSSARARGEISEGVVYGERSQDPYQSPKQKQQESADTTISKEAVISQILNIFFLGKSLCEFKKQTKKQTKTQSKKKKKQKPKKKHTKKT